MSKKKIYISGKIKGLDNYKELFNAAEKEYIDKGWKVINPTRIEHISSKWGDIILDDLHVLNSCDAIFMLNNWQDSFGAQTEHYFAKGNNLEIIYQ